MNNKPSILLVEDEKSIREVLKLNLEMDNYNVLCCDNGYDAINIAKERNIHIILMDVMLPKVNGIDAAREIKNRRPELPIIMLSALNQSTDRVKGLKAGADDYISKPFNYEELVLRIEKQLEKNRKMQGQINTFTIGHNTIDITNNIISNSKGQYQMNSKESLLLKYLFDNKNRVVSREEILANVWGYDTFPHSRTVDNYIASIRKGLLSKATDKKFIILSERGIGYKLIINQES
ncbi:MAG: response regulator transcription factor [Saprospiraceae bacterium]